MKFYIKAKCIFSEEVDITECSLWEKIKDMSRNLFYYSLYLRFIYWPYTEHLSGFRRRVLTVKEYLPILWNDFDFDQGYLLILMKKKLERMVPVFENGHCVGSSKKAKEMTVCINLLDRLIKGDYILKASDEIERRLGKTITTQTKLEDGGTSYSFKNDGKYSENYCSKISKMIYAKMDKQEKYDTELLFKIMSRKLHYWWD